jgi:hypothetical protein
MTEPDTLFQLFDQVMPSREELRAWQKHDREEFGTPPSVHHSQTSMDAAFSIKPGSGRARILDFLRRYPTKSWTDEGLADMLHMNPSTERPRRIELLEAGLIESCGTAKTSSGRSAVLWRATPTSEAV